MTDNIYIGDLGKVTWELETTYGTATTVNKMFGINQGSSPKYKNNMIPIRGDVLKRDVSRFVKGKKEVAGDVTMLPQDGRFLQLFWGEADTSGAPSVYTHIIDAFDGAGKEKDLPTATIEFALQGKGGNDDFVRTMSGAKGNQLTLDFAQEEYLKATMNLIGHDMTPGTTITSVSAQDTDPYMFYQGVIIVDGVTVATIENGSFTHGNKLLPYYSVSDTTPRLTSNPVAQSRDYGLSLSFKCYSATHYNKLITASTTGVTVTATFTRGVNDTLTLTCSNTVFESDDIPIAPETYTVEKLEMIPRTASVTVVDAIATYS